MVLTGSWDEVTKFFRHPKLRVRIRKQEGHFGWIIKNEGKTSLEKLRLLVRSTRLSTSSQLFSGLNLDKGEEVAVDFKSDAQPSFTLEAFADPSADRSTWEPGAWGRFSIQWGSVYDLELTFRASNISDSDAKPRRYRFTPKSANDLELIETKH